MGSMVADLASESRMAAVGRAGIFAARPGPASQFFDFMRTRSGPARR